jgi:hypothetical protein
MGLAYLWMVACACLVYRHKTPGGGGAARWRWCMEWVAGYPGYHENGMYYKFSSSGGTEILGYNTFQPKIFRLKFEYFFSCKSADGQNRRRVIIPPFFGHF